MTQNKKLPGAPTSSLPKRFADLERRFGRERLSKRLQKQATHWARLTHQGEGVFKVEKHIPIDKLAMLGLRLSGLAQRARRNLYAFQIEEVYWSLPKLPKSFDGFRLLQLSDLHLDLEPPLAKHLADVVLSIEHDACVITGDYRNATDDDFNPSMQLMAPILEAISPLRWGILGNHDFAEMIWHLEDAGLPILINEAVHIERGSDKLWIAGVDDFHFYGTHDFVQARQYVAPEECCILLCHSPEPHAEASQHDFDLMLSGHTHAGQLCLPNGRHIICPVKNLTRDYIRGRWSSGDMQGYTSRGTGSCGIPARLNCPPEITIHRLSAC